MTNWQCDYSGCDLPISYRCSICGGAFCTRHSRWVPTHNSTIYDVAHGHIACDTCFQKEMTAENWYFGFILFFVVGICALASIVAFPPIGIVIAVLLPLGIIVTFVRRSRKQTPQLRHKRTNSQQAAYTYRAYTSSYIPTPSYYPSHTMTVSNSFPAYRSALPLMQKRTIFWLGGFGVLAIGVFMIVAILDSTLKSSGTNFPLNVDALLGFITIPTIMILLSTWILGICNVTQLKAWEWLIVILFFGCIAMLPFGIWGPSDGNFATPHSPRQRLSGTRLANLLLLLSSVLGLLFIEFSVLTYCTADSYACLPSHVQSLGSVLGAIGWLLIPTSWVMGLILTAKRGSWAWFAVIFFFAPVAPAMYALLEENYT